MDAISGLDRGIVNGGTDQLDPGLEINLVNAGINLPVYASQDLPLDIGIEASTLPFMVNPPPTQRAFEGYSLRRNPPLNTQIDFSEVARQREISEKQRLASSWNKVANYVTAETQQLRTCLYSNWDPVSARKKVDSLTLAWKSFEATHAKYLPGIQKRERLQQVEERFKSLRESMNDLIEECEKQIKTDQETHKCHDGISISGKSHHSSTSSKTSSSRKEKLRAALLAKKKLELAQRRADEEAELARQNTKRELRRLEDEAVLAELDWQIERDFDEETGQLETIDDVDKVHPQDNLKPLLKESESRKPKPPKLIMGEKPDLTPVHYSTPWDKLPATSKSVPWTGNPTTMAKGKETSPVPNTQHLSYEGPHSLQFKRETACDTKQGQNTPKDHVAAMWKVQLLNGITPTQFSGNPADFPFFRDQVRTHLESELLTDAQRVEYLPKFLKGEALEVIARNRGCSYYDLITTLEERFGRPVQVSQACIEGLVSGSRLLPGDNVSLLNFSEKLNAATKILQGDVEREASVATNLRRIVNRLPNDLVAKWQTENYEIVSRHRTARLQDIAKFVKKQASIRNDPVFGLQRSRRETNEEIKEGKNSSKNKKVPLLPRLKDSTISSTQIEKPTRDGSSATCVICNSAPHRLQQCPVIKQCDRVAVRRQYAASYGFCFNCGRHNPSHSGSSCPEPPGCSKCPGHHLSLLHKENNTGRRFRPRKNNDLNGNVNQGNPPAPTMAPQQGPEQGVRPQASNNHQAAVSSTEVSTARAQVLLNVVPVTVTVEDGNSLSTYAFLDNGCTDTLIDYELADRLNLKGTSERIGIKTIRGNEESVETQRVSFTLSPAEGCGSDIEVDEAYVLSDLNQSEQVLPETVDVSEYPHLQDLTFPEVDLHRVSIIVGNNVLLRTCKMKSGYLQITMALMVTDAHLVGALQGLYPTELEGRQWLTFYQLALTLRIR